MRVGVTSLYVTSTCVNFQWPNQNQMVIALIQTAYTLKARSTKCDVQIFSWLWVKRWNGTCLKTHGIHPCHIEWVDFWLHFAVDRLSCRRVSKLLRGSFQLPQNSRWSNSWCCIRFRLKKMCSPMDIILWGREISSAFIHIKYVYQLSSYLQ